MARLTRIGLSREYPVEPAKTLKGAVQTDEVETSASIAMTRQRSICELHGRPIEENAPPPYEEFRTKQLQRGLFAEPTRIKTDGRSSR